MKGEIDPRRDSKGENNLEETLGMGTRAGILPPAVPHCRKEWCPPKIIPLVDVPSSFDQGLDKVQVARRRDRCHDYERG